MCSFLSKGTTSAGGGGGQPNWIFGDTFLVRILPFLPRDLQTLQTNLTMAVRPHRKMYTPFSVPTPARSALHNYQTQQAAPQVLPHYSLLPFQLFLNTYRFLYYDNRRTSFRYRESIRC